MYEFYELGYTLNYLNKGELHEAAKWGVISKDDYAKIVHEPYTD